MCAINITLKPKSIWFLTDRAEKHTSLLKVILGDNFPRRPDISETINFLCRQVWYKINKPIYYPVKISFVIFAVILKSIENSIEKCNVLSFIFSKVSPILKSSYENNVPILNLSEYSRPCFVGPREWCLT